MKRIAVLSLLALAACASEPEAPVIKAPADTAPSSAMPAEAPGGDWTVSDDFATDAVGALRSPYVGQTVTLAADRAVDPAGSLCKTPVYTAWEGPAAASLGAPVQPQAAQDPAPRKIVAVTCDGSPFLTLVAQPDGTWLTRSNSWVLKLSKAEAKKDNAPLAIAPAAAEGAAAPKPAEAAAAPAAAVPAATVPAKAAEPAKSKVDPRTLVYLASYKTEKSAQHGFSVLSKHSPILAKQQPVVQNVDLGKKGHWVRLYAVAADEGERAQICKQVAKQVDECGARNRE